MNNSKNAMANRDLLGPFRKISSLVLETFVNQKESSNRKIFKETKLLHQICEKQKKILKTLILSCQSFTVFEKKLQEKNEKTGKCY